MLIQEYIEALRTAINAIVLMPFASEITGQSEAFGAKTSCASLSVKILDGAFAGSVLQLDLVRAQPYDVDTKVSLNGLLMSNVFTDESLWERSLDPTVLTQAITIAGA